MARTQSEVWSSGSATAAPASDSPADETSSTGAEETTTGETPRVETKPKTERVAQSKPKTEPKKPDPVATTDDEPEEQTPEDLAGLKTALHAVRGDKRTLRAKWRETEKSLAEHQGEMRALRAQLEAIQRAQQQPQQPAEEPKPEDLDLKYFGDPRGYTDQRFETVQQALERKLKLYDFKWSLNSAKRQYEDFDEAYQAADKVIPNNPVLVNQLMNAEDPGDFIYRVGKNALVAGGDPVGNDLVSLKAKWREEWEAENAATTTPGNVSPLTQARPKPPGSPQTIARARGIGAGSKAQWNGPRSTSQVWSTKR